RALLFMNTFIKLLRARGHNIILEFRGTYAVIKNERVKIQLREKSKVVPVTKNNWTTREFHPNGILSFKSEGYFGSEWKDGKKQLEEQLSYILAKLETHVNALLEIQRVNRERREEEDRKRRLKEEVEKMRKEELQNFKKL